MSDFKNCSKCGATILEFVQFCPRCGAKQGAPLSDDEVQKNPYNILQVSPDAEPEVIEAAYKSLARKYHPDLVGASASEERMKEINWAYQILSNPEKRQEWARKHERGYEPAPKKETSHRQPPSSYVPPDRTRTQATSSAQRTSTPSDTSQVLRPQKAKKEFPWFVVIAVVIMLCVVLSKVSSFLEKTSYTSNAPASTIKTSTPSRPKPTATRPKPTNTPKPTPDWRVYAGSTRDILCQKEDLPGSPGDYYLPEGWMGRYTNKEILSADTDSEPAIKFINETGRLDGWWVKYYLDKTSSILPQYIECQVDQFKSFDGATRALDWTYLPDAYPVSADTTIGQEISVVYYDEISDDGVSLQQYEVKFLYQNLNGVVWTSSTKETANVEYALEVARNLYKRMLTAPLSDPSELPE